MGRTMSTKRSLVSLGVAAAFIAFAAGAGAGASIAPQPYPPGATSPGLSAAKPPDEGKPATISEADFARVFQSGYDKYLALAPAEKKAFESGFRSVNGAPARTADEERAAALWFHRWDAQFKGEPRANLEAANQAVGNAARATSGCADLSRDPDCKPAPTLSDVNGKPSAAGEAAASSPVKNHEPPAPVPDIAATKDAGPVIDEKFSSLLKKAAFGSIVGAIVGIGLLPLLGPLGILLAATLCAAAMLASQKVSGSAAKASASAAGGPGEPEKVAMGSDSGGGSLGSTSINISSPF